ncbi:MAG TPA: SAM-dependent methyltransferase, partial [Myxococcota bacterium]|nr:SAM-dependent methyltransferase [Myxococcota bacterium]
LFDDDRVSERAATLRALAEALAAGTFVKLTLSKPRQRGDGPQQAFGRPVELKAGPHVSFLLRHATKDITVNYPVDQAAAAVEKLLSATFANGHLFTTTGDFELRSNKKGVARFSRHPATFTEAPVAAHDRSKRYVLDPAKAPYLAELGITTPEGHIKSDKADKYRQMQNIIKILDGVVADSSLRGRPTLRVIDMGCGKGYLTFALHDYFNHHLCIPTEVIGVDRNVELMAFCNDVAQKTKAEGLHFEVSGVEDFEVGQVDLLVALHACDVATDIALYKGIVGGAGIVMAVPCCQKELRPQFKAPRDELPLLKHDTFKDRYSQMLTDALRGLLMESQGYQTRVIEFISDAHTHRNVMIVATRGAENAELAAARHREAVAL